jgi:4-hydroxymandelate oxidase
LTGVSSAGPSSGGASGPRPLRLDDFRESARCALPAAVWDFVDGGSGAERTVAANRAALDDVWLWPRVAADVVEPDLSVRLLSTHAAMPVATAPVAYQRLVHPEGELAVARAAAEAGVPFTVSTMSSHRLEDVAALGGSVWFQLYWLRDRELVVSLVRRAEAAGCEALLLTVDVPVMGRRLKDLRNGFSVPARIRAENLVSARATGDHGAGGPGQLGVAEHTARLFEPRLSWRNVEWVRSLTRLPLAVKGILHPDDARHAVTAGADCVVVSNHGGRQLDGAVPTTTALPEVVDAVGGACEVLVDSGFRSGTDVVKALALGASGVLLGRPLMWGLATAGQRGAGEVLSLVRDELRDALLLSGCPDVPSARRLRVSVPSTQLRPASGSRITERE